MKNKKGIIISISVAALILIIFGVSYAYFSAQITGEESSTTLTVSGGSISLTVNGGNNINVENIIPGSGAVATKSITITSNNTTELTSPYTLNMVVESNTFSDNAITYTLTSANNDNNGTVIPGVSEQTGIASGQSTINFGNGYFEPGSGVSHTYTLKLYFLETEADQNNDQGKVITSYFYIASAKAVTKEELLSMGVTYNPDGDSVYSQSKTVTVSASNELNNVASVKYLWSSLTSVTDEELFTETVANGGTVTTPELTGDYYLYTLVTDAEDNSEIHQSAVYKIDNQDPVITITGSNPLTIYKGDTYTELGATASDVQDGDLTSSIVTSGSVNTSTAGTYTITYTVSDASGNETTATRTINVSNPLLSSLILGSGNSNVTSTLTTPGRAISTSGEAVLASTADDYGTSYYFRGSVTNNYVVFANMCWRIVRITGNGAIKLVLYNSNDSSASDPCNSSNIGNSSAFVQSGGSTLLSEFNVSNFVYENAHVGYMYGNVSNFSIIQSAYNLYAYLGSTTYYYGSSYTYNSSTGLFSLSGSITSGIWSNIYSSVISSYPYTCKSTSSSGTCTGIYKINSYNSSTGANTYLVYKGSSSYAQAMANMTKSTILTNLETWYNSKLTSYASHLADVIWCNDKSLASGSGYDLLSTMYSAYSRVYTVSSATPSLVCNSDLGSYTVSDTTNGNGDLDYPIGLLTIDEAAFAGGANRIANSTFYLYNGASGNYWWTMSPYSFQNGLDPRVFVIETNGQFEFLDVNNQYAIRPSIALKSTTAVTGTGTSSDPYVVQ